MSEIEVNIPVQSAPPATGLTQWQRVLYTFTAPSRTFDDIQQGNRSWWMPFLLTLLFSALFFVSVQTKVGWDQAANNLLRQNAKFQERMAQAPPGQLEKTIQTSATITKFSSYATPITILLMVYLGSLMLLATINFGFAGKAKVGGVFTVWMYAGLPGIIKAVLGAAVLFAGAAPESFNFKNFAPTNLAAFLNPADTAPALYVLLTSLDVITIWTMVLLSIGLAKVAGVRRSSGYMAVFGWWALITLASVSATLLFN